MSRYAIGNITFLHQEEDARNMFEDAYQEKEEAAYYLDPTEICVTCGREIFENEKCKTCGQCLRFVNGCCNCRLGGLNE